MIPRFLLTPRLTLIPCPAEVADAAYGGKRQLDALIGATFDDTWLDDDGRGLLTFYAGQLHHDPNLIGWGLWLIKHTAQGVIFGSAGFKGKPNTEGMVEIGYGISSRYRRQGYTFEAAQALVDWAFEQPGVKVVTAECLTDNRGSMRILEKLGMQRTGVQGSYIKWALKGKRGGDEQ